jgi:hypothetical protein
VLVVDDWSLQVWFVATEDTVAVAVPVAVAVITWVT